MPHQRWRRVQSRTAWRTQTPAPADLQWLRHGCQQCQADVRVGAGQRDPHPGMETRSNLVNNHRRKKPPMRSTALLPAIITLLRLALMGGRREAKNPLHPHPQLRWRQHDQQKLCQSLYQSWSIRTPCPGKAAKSKSPYHCPQTRRRQLSPITMWRTPPPS